MHRQVIQCHARQKSTPGKPIGQLLPLTEPERQRLLVEWIATETEYPKDKCIHTLFEEQVARTPDAVAVVFEGEELTYAELNRRANRLAHHLRELGIEHETLVAICVERSLEMVVGLLAILKAGGAYVPLDPDYPARRLAFMLEDTCAPVLLTQSHLRERLPDYSGHVVDLDCLEGVCSDRSDNPEPVAKPDSLAYVIYTSGSTGTPKGVNVPQRGVVRLVTKTNYVSLGPDERFLQFAPLAFDASTFEIWGPLLNGGRLFVFPARLASIDELGRFIQENEITTLWLTAGLFHEWTDEQFDALSGLRQLLTGGDVVSPAQAIRALRRLPNTRLINGYGPTENTTFTCCHCMDSPEQVGQTVSIGRPIANTRVYVLDRHLQPVPIGVPGELCIGGDGLARDYLHSPELTAEKFVTRPFDTCPDERLYRTGDQVRWRRDGTLEFIGRLDYQVKIRGFRVELPEIEAVLKRHPQIKDAVVCLREDRPGEKYLAAYVVGQECELLSISDLRSFVGKALPKHMLPSVFVEMDGFPLTPNGKVDRRSLPAPEAARPELEGAYVAPHNELEHALAKIWRDVLGLEKIGIHDNFFELGGHSLHAMRVVSHIRTLCDGQLSPAQLFRTPTISGLAEFLEQEGELPGGAASPIKRISRERPIALSFAQQRLWLLERLGGGGRTYNIPLTYRIHGRLQESVLQRCLQEVVDRHESLRTTFIESPEGPLQRIAPAVEAHLERKDLSDLPLPQREQEARRLAEAEARREFDLSTGPLFRATLLKLSEEEHCFLFVVHHIVFDGWSEGLLYRELQELYTSLCNGEPSPLEELPVQYADFTLWQREYLQGEVLEKELDYWKTQLEGAPRVLELPTDHARPPQPSYEGRTVSRMFPASLLETLKKLGDGEGATLFMTLLTAFETLLHRYTGQEDLVVGSVVANRHRSEIEELIGFFVNTIALRTNLSDNPPFLELLRRTRERTLGAYAHQDLPFERLVEELHPERNVSHSPLFQVMFVHQNTPQEPFALPGLAVTPLEVDYGASKFDLTMFTYEQPDGLKVLIEYSTDLFEPETIERMFGHFQTLLEGIVANPETPIGELPFLTEAERQQVLVEWNATETEYPKDKCIHTLFEEQVERTPDAVALVFEGEELTYDELNRRANRLAHHLRELGIERETLVAICVERSLEMVVGLLGILKAGGAYVPLDPDYPAQRLAFMLEDTRAPVLLAQSHLRARLPDYSGHIVDLDRLEKVCSDRSNNPEPIATPDSLAYVIYTSGSTGTPKGVMIEHGNLVNFTVSMAKTPGMCPSDVLLAVTTISFDIAGLELFLPLTVGAKTHIATREASLDDGLLAKLLRDSRATVMQATPVTWQMLASSGTDLSGLRILCGGEALMRDLADRFSNHDQPAFNLYGPTETTIWSALNRVTDAATGPLIGKPIQNTRVYVLGRHMQPLPVGVPGELYIGGAGVARGYLNRAELSEERFVQDLFSQEPQSRIYRTGDLVRWRNDGVLEFLGRIDNQVKLRGQRIELGEIEGALCRHSSVERAVVVVRTDSPGDARLVAYVVPSADATPTISELRQVLAGTLPQYMIPDTFAFLDHLPLTPNGKVDRRSLPAPEATRPELESTYAAPRTELEQAIAGIWCDVLGLEKIGIRDNFFELGGHSLLAVRAASRIHSNIGLAVSPAQLFRTPTISGLAGFLEQEGELPGGAASPIKRISREGPSALSFAQQRLWLLERLGGGGRTYNIPLTYRIHGRVQESVLQRCLQEVVNRHESLRTTFIESPEGPLQRIAPAVEAHLERKDLSDLPLPQREQEARRLAEAEARREFDLSTGPLFRATLLKLGEEEHCFLFVVHHIVFDGWSEGLLYRELQGLYASLCNGEPSPLEELPVQYADFTLWQREYLQGEVLEKELDYWKTRLEGAPRVLELPTDHARPPQPSYEGRTVSRMFPASLLETLKKLGDGEGATLFMTLLTAFETLLHRYTGQEDLVVGSVVANRHRSEIEELIGFFVNTIALRTNLSDNPPFLELLRRTRERTLGAYAHQDLPFERLVEELHPERNVSHSPLFQVMFVHQNTPQEPFALPGLAVTPLEVDYGASKFDLTMFTYEQPDGLKVLIEYSTDLFEPETIERLFGHFQTLLEGIVANPETPIGELPFLTEAERQQVLVEWNATETDYPKDKCIHTLFEEQVERTPDAVALVFEGEELTYDELNRRANRLAHHLRELGIERETLVAICVERSLEMVVGLVGILKAGGAYVPLDPDYPSRRLAFMLDDTRAPVLLTQSRLREKLPDYSGHVLDLDRLEEVCSDRSDENLDPVATSESLAYVIYTSGSTGTPKGVSVLHRGVVRLVTKTDYVSLGPDERFLQFAPLAFDASTFEIWGPLLNGGRLFVFPPRLATIEELGRFIRENAITTLWLTAGLFHEWTDEQLDALVGLRQLLTGGDVVSPVQAARALRRLPNTRLINGYGPTENTTFTCCHCMDSPGQVGRTVSIGRPIAGTRVYVLDRYLQPAPIGVPGELCIGGDGLARDYLRSPELTAEKFITSPFDACPDVRLYRTGDEVRRRRDGTLEFIGRLDHQVKIRGFRVELPEIESVLKRHPQIKDAVVCLREDRPGDKCLVAYVVGQEQNPPSPRALRAFIKETLPKHMIPSEFVEVDGLPLTRNGKVDRSSLPAPKVVRRETEDGYVAARNELEQTLVEIWCDVLGLEKVGIHDSFFELGGHSLLVVRVATRLQKSFHMDLSAGRLYAANTVSKQADLLSRGGEVALPTSLVTVHGRGGRPPLVFMPDASGRPFIARAIIDYLPPDQAVYALRMPSVNQDDSQPTTMEQMASECVRALIASEVKGAVHPSRLFFRRDACI